MPLIKRYPNRKLYNTESKQYITLEEIADLVQQGEDIQVLDNASGDDVTTLTLTQIILEREKKQSGSLPKAVLSELIRAGGETMSNIQRSLATTLGWWSQVDDEIRNRFDELVHRGEITENEATRIHDKLTEMGDVGHARTPTMLEKRIARLLEQRGIPSRSELDALAEQLNALEEKIELLLRSERGSEDHKDSGTV